MSAVDSAAGWADVLVRREHRGPGDTLDAARNRAAQKHKLPERTLWSLRYRRPKDIAASIYLKLQRAYEAECGRQEARLAHELEITKALRGAEIDPGLLAQVETFLGATSGQKAAPRRRATDHQGE